MCWVSSTVVYVERFLPVHWGVSPAAGHCVLDFALGRVAASRAFDFQLRHQPIRPLFRNASEEWEVGVPRDFR